MTNAFGANQLHYRFQEEDGAENTATLLGAEDTALSRNVLSDSNIQLRVQINEVGGGTVASATNATWQLQRSIAGGAFGNVTASSTGVKTNTASALTEQGNTTARLTAPGTFAAGRQDDSAGSVTYTHAGNVYTEHVFALTLIAADLADGNAVTFQLLVGGALLTTTQNGAYTVTPTLNITKGVGFTASPGAGGLAATGQASTLAASALTEPTTAALSATGLAPTFSAATNFTASPTTGTITATGFAPTVGTGALQARLTPNAVLASTNLRDTLTNIPPQRLEDIDEETGSDDGEWFEAVNPEADIDIRLSFPNEIGSPPEPITLVGTQTLRVRIRGTSLPSRDWRVDLWESGSEKVPTATGTVTSIIGEIVQLQFEPTDITDVTGAGVEVRIRATAA